MEFNNYQDEAQKMDRDALPTAEGHAVDVGEWVTHILMTRS